MKKLLQILLTLALTMALIACAENFSPGSEQDSQTREPRETAAPEETSAVIGDFENADNTPPPQTYPPPEIIDLSDRPVTNYVEFDFITFGFFNNDPTLLELRAPAGGLGHEDAIIGWGFEQFKITSPQGVTVGDVIKGNDAFNVDFARAPGTNFTTPNAAGSYYVGSAVFPISIPAGEAVGTITVEGEGELLLQVDFYVAGRSSPYSLIFRLTNIFEGEAQ
jgi:hypothetical protein